MPASACIEKKMLRFCCVLFSLKILPERGNYKKKQEKTKVKQRIVPACCSGDVRVGDIEICVLDLTLHPHRLSTFLSIVFLFCIYIYSHKPI